MAELGLTMDQVGKYLWARGAVDRNALVRSRNGQFPTGGSGLMDSEALAILKNFIRKGFEPDLAKIGKMHDQLVDDMLLLQAEEDMLPFDEVAKLRKSQPFYTPLKRLAVFGDFQNAGWGPEHKQKSFIKSQFNRKSIEQKISVCNPLDNLLLDLKRLLEAVARKRAGLDYLPQSLKRVPMLNKVPDPRCAGNSLRQFSGHQRWQEKGTMVNRAFAKEPFQAF